MGTLFAFLSAIEEMPVPPDGPKVGKAGVLSTWSVPVQVESEENTRKKSLKLEGI